MSTYIRNEEDLLRIMKPQIYNWMCHLKEQLPKYLEEFIRSEYYNQYNPKMYERQYRILEAIMTSNIKDIGDGYEFEIYLDPDKVSYDPSFWTSHGITYYKKGDDANTVFHNMANGIHGNVQFGVTNGRFWEKFLTEIGESGIYDIFVEFKKYIGNNFKLTIK